MWWQAPSKRIPSAALKARLSRGKPAPTSTNPELFFFCGEIPRNFFSKDSRMMSYSRREVAMLCVRLCSLTVRQKPEAMVRFYDPMWWICNTYWAKVQAYIFPKITLISISYNILLNGGQMRESYCKVPAPNLSNWAAAVILPLADATRGCGILIFHFRCRAGNLKMPYQRLNFWVSAWLKML